MNTKTLKDLGYFQIIDILKGFSLSELGAVECGKLRPYDTIEEAVKEAKRVSELKKIMDGGKDIPLEGICDVRDALNLAKINESILDVESILSIKRNLTAARKLKNFLTRADSEEYPYVYEFMDRLHADEKLERSISRTIGENNEILDSASPELDRVRKQTRAKREEIIDSLSNMMREKENVPVIQEQVITVRNNRYVLVAKPNFNEHFNGIIHGDSQSGASSYVEPFALVEDNNRMNLLAKREKEEELKILKAITDDIRKDSALFLKSLDALAEFDFLVAKTRFSIALECHEPCMESSDSGRINLRNAYHPLLKFDSARAGGKSDAQKKTVIPINIKFDEGRRGMIISGSNSGGKTAALKTLGLLSAMAKSGMHICADEGSTLIFFDRIFADIGDDQDIRKSMGTFSSHLENIKNILECADASALVLLDELGTGTNPTEGAALFSAILDRLLELRTRFVATTHLDKIKHYAYINPQVENVSVAFNEDTLKPEYRLIYDQIGQSNAINLAKQVGIDEIILRNAEKYMTGDELALSNLLKELTAEKAVMLEEKENLAHIRRENDSLKQHRERMLEKLKEKRNNLVKSKEKEIQDLFYETKRNLRKIIREYKDNKINDIEVFEEISVLRKDVSKKFAITKKEMESLEDFKAGDNVFVGSFNQKGVIVNLNARKKTALVNMGTMRVDIPAGELKKIDADGEKMAGNVTLSRHESNITPEINVIGKTVDEALPIIDKFLDDAYTSNLHEVTIIHGKGTGRLRNGILEHLRQAPYVEDIMKEKNLMAAAGATRVKIR